MRTLRIALSVALVGTALGASPARGTDQESVLVVGDSLEVGTGPYLRRELGGVALTIDARESRSSVEGLDVLGARLSAAHSVVVFDLGVNDDPAQPQALAADLAAARAAVGDRCMVVSTLSRPPYRGVSVDGLNRAVSSFVAESPPAELADWRAAAISSPGALQPDAVHGTPAGYALRAQVVAQAVYACLAGQAPHQVTPPQTPRPVPSARIGARSQPGVLALAMAEIGRIVGSLATRLGAAVEGLPRPFIVTPGSA